MDSISKSTPNETHRKFVYYGADDLLRDLELLKKNEAFGRLLYRGGIKNFFGIPRGGLIIAVHLSHWFNLPLITNPKEISKETLIVDDIADSGKTLRDYLDFHTFTVYENSALEKHLRPEMSLHKKDPREWVVFFWEKM